MAGTAFRIQCLGKRNIIILSAAHFSWLFPALKFNLPVIWSSFELSPEGLNTFKSGHTQQLDKLNELQRGIFVDLGHIEGHQVVQNLNNLSGKKNPSV